MQKLQNGHEYNTAHTSLSGKPEFTENCGEFGNCCIEDFEFIAITEETGLNDFDEGIDGILGIGP